MIQRIGISMTDQELRRLSLLQKRLGIRSRSEFFREIVKRYEKLEIGMKALNSCINGYLQQPESGGGESAAILKASLRSQAYEDWA